MGGGIMEVFIAGFRVPKTQKGQDEFSRELMGTLRGFHMPVMDVSVPTNGEILVEVPDGTLLQNITGPLASFAEVLARQLGHEVSLPFRVPSYGISASAAG